MSLSFQILFDKNYQQNEIKRRRLVKLITKAYHRQYISFCGINQWSSQHSSWLMMLVVEDVRDILQLLVEWSKDFNNLIGQERKFALY
jgi:hypothetical protein